MAACGLRVRVTRDMWLRMHRRRAERADAAEDSADLATLTDAVGNRWVVYAQALDPDVDDDEAPDSIPPGEGGGHNFATSALAIFAQAEFGAGKPFGAAVEVGLGLHSEKVRSLRVTATRELLRREMAPSSTHLMHRPPSGKDLQRRAAQKTSNAAESANFDPGTTRSDAWSRTPWTKTAARSTRTA